MENAQTATTTDPLVELTGNIVSAYLANHSVAPDALPGLIHETYNALKNPGAGVPSVAMVAPRPAVPVEKSISDCGEFIVCLEDGKELKSMKRHLSTSYGMTPEEYRAKWGLPADYPMVAPRYSQLRSQLAKKTGLGKSKDAHVA